MKTTRSKLILASFFPVLGYFILLTIGRFTGNSNSHPEYNSLDHTFATCGTIIIDLRTDNDKFISVDKGTIPASGSSHIAPADNVVFSEPGMQAGHGQPKRVV